MVNLRRARKARDRAQAAATADTNRARFGQGKAEREAVAREAERLARTVDGAKLERPGEE